MLTQMKSALPARHRSGGGNFSLAIINVVFLLLFFFILAGSLVQHNEMEVRPPFTRNLPLERLPRPLLVISKNGGLFLDGRPVQDSELLSAIQNITTPGNPQSVRVNVLADGGLPARSFMRTIDVLRTTGLPVRIVTIRKKTDGLQ